MTIFSTKQVEHGGAILFQRRGNAGSGLWGTVLPQPSRVRIQGGDVLMFGWWFGLGLGETAFIWSWDVLGFKGFRRNTNTKLGLFDCFMVHDVNSTWLPSCRGAGITGKAGVR